MKFQRRQFLHLASGAVVLPAVSHVGAAQTDPTPPKSAQSTRPLAERLAAYADALRYDDLDAATIERVKAHFIDTLGCGIAAFDEKPVRICRDIAQSVQGGATIIGTTRKTSPDLAAFVNGAASRYYDLNDTYVGRMGSRTA